METTPNNFRGNLGDIKDNVKDGVKKKYAERTTAVGRFWLGRSLS